MPRSPKSPSRRKPPAAAEPRRRTRSIPATPFPIVGIGASAGGLAAISELLEALPEKSGMAFVIISHLAPQHESILDTLLARTTRMPVRQVRNGEAIEPNHIYVAPPGKRIAVHDGNLQARASGVRSARPTVIDHFLTSLAIDRGSAARGVVLSGVGNDGTEGLLKIRKAGGVTFAQDPASAQFDGMPSSAIRAGCVDFVLPPAAIARQLVHPGRRPPRAPSRPASGAAVAVVGDPFNAILAEIQRVTGTDFRQYKSSMLRRRMHRRTASKGFPNLTAYLQHLLIHTDEVRDLFADLLIHVSSFFRDAEAFGALERKVIVPLVERADVDAPIRVWVPGCARGEEVYTIGMLLLEHLGPGGGGRRIQLFGTDISAPDIDVARVGRFPEQIAADVAPQRLKRFFNKVEGGYQVSQELRERCVFACQEVGSDPPFSNLDLISCRNVLIYFARPLQERVIEIFHYALKPNGYLFLGRSESLAGHSRLFAMADEKHRIYRRKSVSAAPVPRSVLGPGRPQRAPYTLPAPTVLPESRQDVDRLLVERYAPPGFHVDEDLQISSFIGDVSAYLQPVSGQANLQLTRMLPAGMALDIRTAIRAARKSRRPVRRETTWAAADGSDRTVHLVVMSVTPAGSRANGYVVLLEPDAEVVRQARPVRTANRREQSELVRTSRLLAATREQLQTVIEEQENVAQELRVSHEEALSSNEELQSSNEELETAKEELQSANEELATVNEELQNRNQELDQLAGELGTLIAGVNIPIVHLDRECRVRRFSPSAQDAFNLIPSDVGREFSQIKPPMALPDLGTWLTAVLDRGEVTEREVQGRSGRWYSVRLRPFRNAAGRIDGVLIALVDIDASKRNAAAIVETISDPLLVLDSQFRVITVNPAFCSTFRVNARESESELLFELGNGQWDLPELHRLLESVLPRQQRFDDFRVDHTFPMIGRKAFRISGQQIVDEGVGTRTILLVFHDVTEQESSVAQRLRDAREQEAKSIAHELHDLSSGGLASLGIELARLCEQLPARSDEAIHGLRAAQKRIQALAANLHELARRIHPSVLNELGLTKALRGECQAFEDRYEVPVSFRVTGAVDRMPEGVSLCAYRVVQEALRNIARHAKAGKVAIRMGATAREFRLRIQDSGVGFDVDAAHGGDGLGLLGMADRVAAVSGTLAIESEPGTGTTIDMKVPLGTRKPVVSRRPGK